jgi:hypothetical protein
MYIEVLDLRCSDIDINIYIMYKRHVFKPFTSRFLFKNLRCDYMDFFFIRSLQGGTLGLALLRSKTKLGRNFMKCLFREDGMGGFIWDVTCMYIYHLYQ